MERTITILKPGLSTSVQDKGRSGYYHLGIPPSGAMDIYSFYAANLLVGNDENDAVIECALMASEIMFNCDAVFAVTGAECTLKVNNEEMQMNKAIEVRQGDTLSFSFMKLGARIYIAIAGGIDVPIVLGSRSTYTLGSIGGHKGRNLLKGDVVKIGNDNNIKYKNISLPKNLHNKLEKSVKVRVIKGLYDYRLTTEGRNNFYTSQWKVGSEADRIGYRCKSNCTLSFIDRKPPFGAGSDPSNIVDAPYPVGSIQVPSGQEPIILHKDAVSGGGYAMIATVITADMDIIAQLQPNYEIKFEAVSMQDALQARKEYFNRLQDLRNYIYSR